MPDEINFNEFPTTRYQGSKRKIVSWIYDNIKDLEFDTALDACGGSATVSYLLKKMGKEVTYNDKLKFNHLIGTALIENSSVKFNSDDISNLLNHRAQERFISEQFDGIYFLPNENRWLDKVAQGIVHMNHYTGQILEHKKAMAFYALIQASMIKRPFNLFHRNNLNIRTNDVERHFGNKTTWEKSFTSYLRKFAKEANSMIFDSGRTCRALNQSLLELNQVDYDLVYIDPPYLNSEGSNETANYLKCYHFLEGLVQYASWDELIDYDTNNLRLKSVDQANDFKRENIYETFDLILEKFRNSIIVVSYKRSGTPSIDFIVNKMKRHKTRVITRSMHYKYALNSQNGDAEKNREVLIIGT